MLLKGCFQRRRMDPLKNFQAPKETPRQYFHPFVAGGPGTETVPPPAAGLRSWLTTTGAGGVSLPTLKGHYDTDLWSETLFANQQYAHLAATNMLAYERFEGRMVSLSPWARPEVMIHLSAVACSNRDGGLAPPEHPPQPAPCGRPEAGPGRHCPRLG